MDVKLLILLSTFCLPLKNLRVNSGFGTRVHPITGKLCVHQGVDLFARSDTVFAMADGNVEAVGFNSNLGRFVKIGHGELESVYGHLSIIGVAAGDSVSCGAPIALTGATGRVTGEHLHFGISYLNHSIDPLAFLSGWLNKRTFITEQDHEKELERTDR